MLLKTLFGFLKIEGFFIFMGLEAKLVLTSLSGIITGILVSTGHLDQNNANAFQQDIQTAGGLIMSILSLGYLLEHQLIKIKADVKPKDTTQVTVTTPNTTIQTTQPTPPEVPAQP